MEQSGIKKIMLLFYSIIESRILYTGRTNQNSTIFIDRFFVVEYQYYIGRIRTVFGTKTSQYSLAITEEVFASPVPISPSIRRIFSTK